MMRETEKELTTLKTGIFSLAPGRTENRSEKVQFSMQTETCSEGSGKMEKDPENFHLLFQTEKGLARCSRKG